MGAGVGAEGDTKDIVTAPDQTSNSIGKDQVCKGDREG
jgi:hypothetical protein